MSGALNSSDWFFFPEEKLSQREEAFARATVALTRAQRFCFIMSLDERNNWSCHGGRVCSMVGVCVMSNPQVAPSPSGVKSQ